MSDGASAAAGTRPAASTRPAGEERYETWASLRVAGGPLVGPVMCRVVSMLLARANCPVDRVDDAMVVCDALSAHALSHTGAGNLALAVGVRQATLELRVGELPAHSAERLVRDTMLPGVGNVLERMTDTVRVERGPDGTSEELVLEMSF